MMGIAMSIYISGCIFSLILDYQYGGNSGIIIAPLVFLKSYTGLFFLETYGLWISQNIKSFMDNPLLYN